MLLKLSSMTTVPDDIPSFVVRDWPRIFARPLTYPSDLKDTFCVRLQSGRQIEYQYPAWIH